MVEVHVFMVEVHVFMVEVHVVMAETYWSLCSQESRPDGPGYDKYSVTTSCP